jgi:hypothetical protein
MMVIMYSITYFIVCRLADSDKYTTLLKHGRSIISSSDSVLVVETGSLTNCHTVTAQLLLVVATSILVFGQPDAKGQSHGSRSHMEITWSV